LVVPIKSNKFEASCKPTPQEAARPWYIEPVMASPGSPDFVSEKLFWADKPLASSGPVGFGRQQDKPIFGFMSLKVRFSSIIIALRFYLVFE